MPALPSYFTSFLQNIRPTEAERTGMKEAHQELREKLAGDAVLSEIIVSDFLQGSYKRHTAGKKRGKKGSDVDLVVVTNLDEDDFPDPRDVLEKFRPFLRQHYKGQYKFEGRSAAIQLEDVKLDLVVTSAPSEAERQLLSSKQVRAFLDYDDGEPQVVLEILAKAREAGWKLEPLRIPDREAKEWQDTHPLEQIRWTIERNAACNGHYVNVVKAIKWWWRVCHPGQKYPKGYPLEHMVGDCCPEGIASVAEGVVRTLENIRDTFRAERLAGTTPVLRDRGVEQNVWKRITPEDFCAFYDQVAAAAETARQAFDLPQEELAESVKGWQALFGAEEFPSAPTLSAAESQGGFTTRVAVTAPSPRPQRFA